MLPQTAADYYRSQQRLTVATLAATRRSWRQMGPDFDGSWRRVRASLTVLVTAAQLGAARAADEYVPAVLDEIGVDADPEAQLNPQALSGEAPDGRPLDSLLYGAVVHAGRASNAGADQSEALARGGRWLDVLVSSVVADAGRQASGVAVAVRPQVTGYVRMVNLPACSRCVVLAGRFYRWNDGFPRHPGCDCRHVPSSEDVAGDMTTDPRRAVESGQVRGLSKADRQAIEDGADVGQVVNSRRGMYVEDGRKLTREGTSRRGRAVRPRPEQIYRDAENREDAVRLLRRFGYVT